MKVRENFCVICATFISRVIFMSDEINNYVNTFKRAD